MKIIIALVLFAFVGISNVQAQSPSLSAVNKEKVSEIDMLTQKLNLSSEQVANISKTIKAFKSTEDRLRAGGLSAADKQEELAKLAKRKDGNMQTFLTKEQYAIYSSLIKQ
ncbi:hypothetical protein DCS32_15030 [Dokdonia sp. Dokd-P16]|uniref:hypothetical protein n=1 Tax=Dokdonia sp. Dokd-P16 TaxID=2173169 RepID=UPI000D5456FB|nr:hypothetical protein [Dokdonia sp. Dokd-P16]AWH75429.1 hypothetical protein DCS32_15030 [Dokdonia sp. Dokd-P16]